MKLERICIARLSTGTTIYKVIQEDGTIIYETNIANGGPICSGHYPCMQDPLAFHRELSMITYFDMQDWKHSMVCPGHIEEVTITGTIKLEDS